MTDPVDQFFEREREAVPTLSPPPGRFDELQTVARRRRSRNTTMVSAAAAAVIAVVGTGAVLGAQNLKGSTNTALEPAGPTAKVPVSASATPAGTSTSTAAAPAVDPTVPSDFTAWSVSFYGTNGWALGGYTCKGGLQCVAVVKTTDGLATWHTVAEPAFAAEYGMSAGHAIIRFQSAANGWMVGSQGVYATHDGGSSWAPIGVLQSEGIDALEALHNQVYAVGTQGSVLWHSSDPGSDTWVPEPGLGLPPAAAGTKDSISLEDQGVVAVVRSTGWNTTVRLRSNSSGGSWQTLTSPCAGGSASARLFVVVDPGTGRFVCGNGQVWGVWFDHSQGPRRDVTFSTRSTTGKGTVAESVSHVRSGTFVAYQGAGLQHVLTSGGKSKPVHGDFTYVGMTTDSQGVALKANATNSYWLTVNGDSWKEKHFR